MNPRSRLRLLFAAAVATISLAGCKAEQSAPAQPAPPQVDVVSLRESDVMLTSELPGRTTALRQAEIRPQVTGIVTQRLFQEGADIEAGQQLYQIDDASYKAALSTAQAQVAQAKANLSAAKAREARYKDLIEADAISQQDYDDALAGFLQAQAALQSAQAAVETAQINLRYTRVLAPISGRIGKSNVTEGALVTAGQAQALAMIQQLDPIHVDVSQSVGRMLDIRRQLLQGSLLNEGKPSVSLTLEDGSVYEHRGTLEFSEVDVNQSTGTVVLRALIPNPDQLLLPGMFVRAEIAEGRRPNTLLIPQQAVTHDRQGNAVTLVVNSEGVVEQRALETGRAVGDAWLVRSGLEAGERVIVAGVQKAQPGSPVTAIDVGADEQPHTAAVQVEGE